MQSLAGTNLSDLALPEELSPAAVLLACDAQAHAISLSIILHAFIRKTQCGVTVLRFCCWESKESTSSDPLRQWKSVLPSPEGDFCPGTALET